jgi:hypothetical protein
VFVQTPVQGARAHPDLLRQAFGVDVLLAQAFKHVAAYPIDKGYRPSGLPHLD